MRCKWFGDMRVWLAEAEAEVSFSREEHKEIDEFADRSMLDALEAACAERDEWKDRALKAKREQIESTKYWIEKLYRARATASAAYTDHQIWLVTNVARARGLAESLANPITPLEQDVQDIAAEIVSLLGGTK